MIFPVKPPLNGKPAEQMRKNIKASIRYLSVFPRLFNPVIFVILYFLFIRFMHSSNPDEFKIKIIKLKNTELNPTGVSEIIPIKIYPACAIVIKENIFLRSYCHNNIKFPAIIDIPEIIASNNCHFTAGIILYLVVSVIKVFRSLNADK